jgi:hypothetical protein
VKTSITIVGIRAVEITMAQMPGKVHAALRQEVTAIAGEIEGAVRGAEPRRTGKLQSETLSFVDEPTPTSVRGRVKITGARNELIKAAALEYGAHGVGTKKAFGRSQAAMVSSFTGHAQAMASAFSGRPGDIMAHRFLRGSFDPGAVEQRLTRAVNQVQE